MFLVCHCAICLSVAVLPRIIEARCVWRSCCFFWRTAIRKWILLCLVCFCCFVSGRCTTFAVCTRSLFVWLPMSVGGWRRGSVWRSIWSPPWLVVWRGICFAVGVLPFCIGWWVILPFCCFLKINLFKNETASHRLLFSRWFHCFWWWAFYTLCFIVPFRWLVNQNWHCFL